MKRCYMSLFCFAVLLSCSSVKHGELKNKTVEGQYKKACGLLKSGSYTDAAGEFKEIDTLFPYSAKASEGQVLAAYCNFMASNYVDAMREIDVFLRYHPSHTLVPYASYLRAMCIYMQVSSIGRDAKAAKDARAAFTAVAEKFSETPYAADSLKRIMILDDMMAAHVMMIGRYYQSNKNMLAAIGRYNFVIIQLHDTNYAPEAYYRIIECCLSTGLVEEARSAYDALKANFPENKWSKKAVSILNKKFVRKRKHEI